MALPGQGQDPRPRPDGRTPEERLADTMIDFARRRFLDDRRDIDVALAEFELIVALVLADPIATARELDVFGGIEPVHAVGHAEPVDWLLGEDRPLFPAFATETIER